MNCTRFNFITIEVVNDSLCYVYLSDDIEKMDSVKHDYRFRCSDRSEAEKTARRWIKPKKGIINQRLQYPSSTYWKTLKKKGTRDMLCLV